MEIKITQDITAEKAYNLLVSALEGGSNYWYMLEDIKKPAKDAQSHYKDSLWDKDRKGDKGPDYIHTLEVPFQAGGALIFSDVEGETTACGECEACIEYDIPHFDSMEGDNCDNRKPVETYTLDYMAIQKGLEIMAEKYPSHWADFVGGNDDADTGDVFLQCALFGEVIYG